MLKIHIKVCRPATPGGEPIVTVTRTPPKSIFAEDFKPTVIDYIMSIHQSPADMKPTMETAFIMKQLKARKLVLRPRWCTNTSIVAHEVCNHFSFLTKSNSSLHSNGCFYGYASRYDHKTERELLDHRGTIGIYRIDEPIDWTHLQLRGTFIASQQNDAERIIRDMFKAGESWYYIQRIPNSTDMYGYFDVINHDITYIRDSNTHQTKEKY